LFLFDVSEACTLHLLGSSVRAFGADRATTGIDEVYALAADMGRTGFISCNHGRILHNNSLIDLHCIEADRQNGAPSGITRGRGPALKAVKTAVALRRKP
jgi:hypothetical protein